MTKQSAFQKVNLLVILRKLLQVDFFFVYKSQINFLITIRTGGVFPLRMDFCFPMDNE